MVQWRSKNEHGFRQEIIRVETKCLKEPCFVLVMVSNKKKLISIFRNYRHFFIIHHVFI